MWPKGATRPNVDRRQTNGMGDRLLEKLVGVDGVKRPPMDWAEDSRQPDGAAGAVGLCAACDITNTDRCRTYSPKQDLGWNADVVVEQMEGSQWAVVMKTHFECGPLSNHVTWTAWNV